MMMRGLIVILLLFALSGIATVIERLDKIHDDLNRMEQRR